MSHASDPVGTLDAALAHAARLLDIRPLLAAEQAEEILRVLPGQPLARQLLVRAKLRLDALDEALPLLQSLEVAQPGFELVQCEAGLTLRRLGRSGEAIGYLKRAVASRPDLGPAWLGLAEIYTDIGDVHNADLAFGQHIKCATRDPRMRAAGAALYDNRLPEAESLLRAQIREQPANVAALRMLAEVAARLRRYADAEVLLRHCVALAPGFMPAWHNLALVLHRQDKAAEALSAVDHCLSVEPGHVSHRNLKAAILGTIGEYESALELYRGVLHEYPDQAKIWMSFGHALKTAGHETEGIDAYRRSIELMPDLGEAYWSLANLKTFRFTPQDVGAMRAALSVRGLDPHERPALPLRPRQGAGGRRQFAESFAHYAEANRLRRLDVPYDADEHHTRLRQVPVSFSPRNFSRRGPAQAAAHRIRSSSWACRARDRRCIEQILASHSQVEGTMELPDIIAIARRVAAGARRHRRCDAIAGVLATLSADNGAVLVKSTLQRTRIHRKRGTAVLHRQDAQQLPASRADPRDAAEREDHRRAPPSARLLPLRLQAAFCMGQQFCYSLEDIGRYYRRLRGADGALRPGGPLARSPRDLRANGE